MPETGQPVASPLTTAQSGIWFAQGLAPESPDFIVGEFIELCGPLDVARLKIAIREVIAALPPLHLRFFVSADGPRQVEAPATEVPLRVVDLTDVADPHAAAQEWMQRESRRPMDLAQGPLFGHALLRLAPDLHVLQVRYHHLVVDGASGRTIVAMMAERYTALHTETGAASFLRESWRDMLEADAAYRQSSRFARDRRYWLEAMTDRPEPVTLSGLPPVGIGGFVQSRVWLPAEQVGRLRTFGAAAGATLPQLVTAACALYLHRLAGTGEPILGIPVTARAGTGLRDAVGMCSNVLPLRVPLRPGMTVATLIHQVARGMRGMLRHERYSHHDLRRDLGLRPEDPELWGMVVNALSFDYNLRFGPLDTRVVNLGNWPVADLALAFYDQMDGRDVCLELNARPGRYSPEALDGHLRRLASLLERWSDPVAAPLHRAVGAVDLLLPQEQPMASHPIEVAQSVADTLAEAFRAQVLATPDAIALSFGAQKLSYSALDDAASRLAAMLHTLGIGPEQRVAIALPRSIDLAVAVLAVLKAGAAYIVLDPDYPQARRDQVLEDARPALVLTTAGEPALPCRTVQLDSAQVIKALAAGPATMPHPVAPRPEHVAYVIYTSGSTGRPKGVEVSHRNVLRLFEATRKWFDFGPRDVWTVFHSMGFDFSVWEVWGAWLHGGEAVIVPGAVARAPNDFLRLLVERRVTVLNQTPWAFEALMRAEANEPALSADLALRWVVFGGEALDATRLLPWFSRHPATAPRLVNMYGITETTVHASYFPVTPEVAAAGGASRIGVALPDLRLDVLDGALARQPVGVAGELYVGGAGLARGYLGRPGLTAERFVADPYGPPGARLYRSGDLARWRPDGTLEYLGRTDRQIKLRGFRIELGEIEALLRSHPGVRDARVLYRAEGGSAGQLLGYVLPRLAATDPAEARDERLAHWQHLYDATTYAGAEAAADDFDIAGWNASDTGAAIPEAEMRAWVDATVSEIATRLPADARVLEIGCGTGLLLLQLAGRCAAYTGLDFSDSALRRLGASVARRRALEHVRLRQARAHELDGIADASLDVVILNSVVQYFPDLAYLREVLAEVRRVLRPGGAAFVGDVRNLALLGAYQTWVQTARAEPGTTGAALRRRIARGERQEEELLLSAEFFEALAGAGQGWVRAEPAPKAGGYDNELSRFRYDLWLTRGEAGAPGQVLAAADRRVGWSAGGSWAKAVEQALAAGESVALEGVPDRRSAPAVEMAAALQADPAPDLHGLRRAVTGAAGEGIAGLVRRAAGHGAALAWSGFGPDGRLNVTFRPRWKERPGVVAHGAEARYANTPARAVAETGLVPALTALLRARLPSYMMPTAIMTLADWPLTPNGKFDREALPVPGRAERAGYAYVAPKTDTERSLALLWQALLTLDQVGRDDDFFDLGGNSLLATQLMSRVRDEFGVDLPLRTLFDMPRLSALADAIAGSGSVAPSVPLRPVIRVAHPLLSFAQLRLWFLARLEGSSATYNIPLCLRLEGTLDTSALHRALCDVVARHESLRTVVAEHEGEPWQRVLPASEAEIALPVEPVTAAGLVLALQSAAHEPFDIEREQPIKARLWQLDEQSHVLLVLLHHVAADGWSLGPLTRDLGEAYAARRAGRAPGWPPLVVQYADYSSWQRERLGCENDDSSRMAAGLAFWRGALAGAPAELELPADHPRPPVASYRGASVALRLDAVAHGRLLEVARTGSATPFMVLHAGLAGWLSRLGAGDDIVIGSPVAGRGEQALDGLIGCFVNTLALRCDVSGQPSLAELVGRVRAFDLAAFAHQDLPFERLVDALAPQRSPGRNPVFQVMLTLQNTPASALSLPGLLVSVEPVAAEVAKVDLAVNLVEEFDAEGRAAGLSGSLDFSLDRFTTATAQDMARRLERWLEMACQSPDAPLHGPDLLEPANMVAQPARTPAVEYLGRVLPLSSNGTVAPRSIAEAVLCQLYKDLLGLAEIGIDDNFFALGGDSIQVILLSNRARRFGYALGPIDVFLHPRVRDLAERLERIDATPEPAQAEAEGELPATPIMASYFARGGLVELFVQAAWLHVPADLTQAHVVAAMGGVDPDARYATPARPARAGALAPSDRADE